MVKRCTVCGGQFSTGPTGGRPRSRCDRCRSNHDRADGTVWRSLRAQVLREEPICCIVGCGRAATQVDHVIPLKLRPDLAHDRANLRGICASHNAAKGARLPVAAVRYAEPRLPSHEDCQICERCVHEPRRHHWCL
jgi:5-methylcytosine-specific restriction endonuclease McrA